MRKVIDRKVYDTEKSNLIADYWNNLSSSDVFYELEELYRTRKGYFFLYGKGGAMSKYSDGYGNQSWGTQVIIPMSPDDAYKWLEENNKVDEIEELFPEKVEEA